MSMLHPTGPLSRRTSRESALRGLSWPSRRDWFAAPAFADLAAVADFNADRYAITAVPTAQIGSASAAELCVKRSSSFAEWFAFTAASTTARSYLDAGGALRNDLAADQPRFDFRNGRRQLAVSNGATNLALNSATGTTQGVTVSGVAHTLSFTGTGSIAWSGAATGSLAGTGAGSRVFASFTPTAGTVTLTPTGDVRLVQVETGSIATAYIPTTTAAVSRAIESARMSPAIEAILQRLAASIVVRGQNLLSGNSMSILGSNAAHWIRVGGGGLTGTYVVGGVTLNATGVAFNTAAWAIAHGFEPSGRSVVRNGSPVASDANTPLALGAVRLGGYQGLSNDGHYDFVGIAPSRLADARLTALAVPV